MFTLRIAEAKQKDLTTNGSATVKGRAIIKERYKVNLPLQMAECEANFLRINKLVTHPAQDVHRILVTRGKFQWLHQLRVIERSPYTTTLELTRTTIGESSQWLSMPKLTLRVYHDARLVEVLAWEGHKRLRPRYEYPNQSMYQSDEKYQLNRFLGEWLSVCVNQGQRLNVAIP